jgi:hypothetical protein
MTLRVESDDWAPRPNILDETTLAKVQRVLEESPIIVERWFYRGGSSPERLVFEEFDAFVAYVRAARPGDAFDVWRFDVLCRSDNRFVEGKRPDADGAVPKRGAY